MNSDAMGVYYSIQKWDAVFCVRNGYGHIIAERFLSGDMVFEVRETSNEYGDVYFKACRF